MSEQRLLLTADVVGGVWDVCLVLATELSQASHVTLLALGEPTSAQRDEAARTGAQLISAPLKLEWMQDSQDDVRKTRELVTAIVRDLRPTVLHANHFAAASADVDVPLVLTLHSDVLSWRRWTYGSTTIPDEWRSYAALVRQACARADALVAVSQFLAGEVRELYGIERAIDVIRNGWPSPPHATPSSTCVTLLAGRIWDAGKNVQLAAEAAHGWDPGEVYLAGEQHHPDSGAPADIPPPLEPLGFLPRQQMDAWLRRATIYLSPARYDPFGLLPLQAALNGCALLLSDIPSYREVWDGAACFFRSNDPVDLRRRWRLLLDDTRLTAEFRKRPYQRATSDYTATRMADAYRAIYANVRQRAAA